MKQVESKLNRFDSMPLYVQLSNIVREKIDTEEWPPNSMIPSENELSKLFGVSRMTIRSVITQFAAEGALYRIQGKGTFVSEAKYVISSTHYTGVREQLESQGHEVETHLISCTRAHTDRFLSKMMNLPSGEELHKIKRVRSVRGVNISYHETFIPVSLCPDLDKKDLTGDPLCKIISQHYGFYNGRTIETMESYIADSVKAGYLSVFPGFPLILLQNKLYSKEEVLYEYTRVYFRGDKIKLRFEHTNKE